MGCSKCGAGRLKSAGPSPVFLMSDEASQNLILLGAMQTFTLKLGDFETKIKAGKTFSVTEATLKQLQAQQAPIWVF